MERFLHSRILVLIAILFCCSSAFAATEAGKILYSRGVVSIVDIQDSSRGGKTGSVVYEGDRVVTGRGALAQVRLSDGALIALRGNSDYKIEKQSYGEDEDLYEQAGKLFTGWMRSITGTIGQKYPQKVSQSTSVATIGIRGTIYQIIHIPPEGLPGFAGEEPGTYVYLEQGSVQLTGEQGERLLKPGDVVFIPAAGGAPRLLPGKKQLFLDAEEGVIEVVEAEGQDFSDEINQTLSEQLGKQPPGAVGFYAIFGSPYLATSSDLSLVGAGPGRQPSQLRYFESDGGIYYYTSPNPGATPTNTGAVTLASGSFVNWGVFASTDYQTVDDVGNPQSPPFQEWHYMIADNVVGSSAELLSSGLVGSTSYNYVGGSGLVGTSNFTSIDSGNILVDFDTQEMFVTLNLSDGALPPSSSVSLSNNDASYDGFRGIADFYSGGINIIDDPLNTFVSGQISGAFVDDGGGIISAVRVDESSVGTSYGTAAFEADTPVNRN